jgi:hypothetical protein
LKPASFVLSNIYPNPFNSAASFTISLPQPSALQLSVINVLGQNVAVLENGRFAVGQHQFTFDATGLSGGVYFVRASVPGHMNQMQKVVLLK